MSNSSYPSPVSVRPSPRVREHSGSGAPPRDPSATQRSLAQASASLEAAYDRIRQVRLSLIQLQESYNSFASRFPDQVIGPNHDAIVLTGDSTSEEPQSPAGQLSQYEIDFETSTSSNAPARWDTYFPDSFTTAPTDPLATRNSVASSVSLNSPVSPHRSLPSRRSLLDANPSQRRESDDPSTSLGRQVAARQSNQSSPSQNSLPADIVAQQQYLREAQQTVRELERISNEYQRRLGSMPELPPLQELSSMEPILEYPRPTPAEILSRRSLDANVLQATNQTVQSSQTNSSLMPPRLTSNGRRWPRLSRADIRQGSIQSPSSSRSDATRLSMLSNFSINNMSTPSSAVNRDRPLLFDEPMSYEPGELFPSQAALQDRFDTLARRAIMRRQSTVEARDHGRTLQQDLSHYVLPRLISPTMGATADFSSFSPTDTTQELRQSSGGAASTHSRTRRRGWARLDADGNEIPSDEEEELERLRSEQRVRANNVARLTQLAEQVAMSGERRTGSSDAEDTSSIHIQRAYDRMGRLVGSRYNSEPKSRGNDVPLVDIGEVGYEPFKPSPLPMPLVKMVSTRATAQTGRRMFVLKKNQTLDDR
ncbi:hypothetical protein PC9H_004085 [Pleurotus ostreatus]|uniref:Uncharacterized protein n=1 Tax=Pleurotus ostreatus TaxID=5322 RepID=A0A8H6ZZL3_PLEOS|nr:uncharacterized protein PC9H_004085 [Pleurotus ostreatus]KAF7437248.1 hypothetical protein PC9H_004085 [Pleurotus ostreatus]KAJ8703135.1 hypothetical protein PTI98_001785 [Pleurotus ostreatus]